MSRTIYTVTIHSHLDPACEYHKGVRAWRGFLWLFRCDACRGGGRDDRP